MVHQSISQNKKRRQRTKIAQKANNSFQIRLKIQKTLSWESVFSLQHYQPFAGKILIQDKIKSVLYMEIPPMPGVVSLALIVSVLDAELA